MLGLSSLIGNVTPSPDMVKMLVCGMGYDDPQLLDLIDKAMSGKFSAPLVQPFFFDSMCIPEGVQPMIVTSESKTEELTLLMFVREKPKKPVDTRSKGG